MTDNNKKLKDNFKVTLIICSIAAAMDSENEKGNDKLQEIIIESGMTLGLQIETEEVPALMSEVDDLLNNLEDKKTEEYMEQTVKNMSDDERMVVIYNAYRIMNADNVITEDEKGFLDSLLSEYNYSLEDVIEKGENEGFDLDSIFEGLGLDLDD